MSFSLIINARLVAITEADFKSVASLGATIWRSHYSKIVSMAQIAIYRKAGFQVREEAIFDIGNGYFMDDYVMEKVILQ